MIMEKQGAAVAVVEGGQEQRERHRTMAGVFRRRLRCSLGVALLFGVVRLMEVVFRMPVRRLLCTGIEVGAIGIAGAAHAAVATAAASSKVAPTGVVTQSVRSGIEVEPTGSRAAT